MANPKLLCDENFDPAVPSPLANVFPGLEWSKGPQGTLGYAVIIQGENLKGAGTSIHLALLNVPAAVTQLEAGATKASEKTPQLAFRKYFEKVDLALASDSASAPLSSLPTAASAELVSLYEFCHSFGRNLDLPDALPIVARRLRRLVPFTTMAFFIDDGENNLKAVDVTIPLGVCPAGPGRLIVGESGGLRKAPSPRLRKMVTSLASASCNCRCRHQE